MSRAIILKTFKSHSLSLSAEAHQELLKQLKNRLPKLRVQYGQIEDDKIVGLFLDSLLKGIEKDKLISHVLKVDTLIACLNNYDKSVACNQYNDPYSTQSSAITNPIKSIPSAFENISNDMKISLLPLDSEEILSISTAFDLKKNPKYIFNPNKRVFEIDTNPHVSLIGNALDRVNMFRQRYHVIHQRFLKDPLFSTFCTQLFNKFSNTQSKYHLTKIESLIGSNGKKYVFGMIVQLEEGRYHLEDLKATIELDFLLLDISTVSNVWITEYSFLVCEGEMCCQRDVFVVERIHLPSVEPLKTTLNFYPSINFFSDSQLDHRILERIEAYENRLSNLVEKREDVMLIFSDIWLDDLQVTGKLEEILAGWESTPPRIVVLMGNFVSTEKHSDFKVYEEGLNRLSDIWDKCELSKSPNTQLILIPGPLDPTPFRDILPKPPLFSSLQKKFLKFSNSGRVVFGTNPTKIRFCTRQILLFREDMMNRMRRHCIFNTEDANSINENQSSSSDQEINLEKSQIENNEDSDNTAMKVWFSQYNTTIHIKKKKSKLLLI